MIVRMRDRGINLFGVVKILTYDYIKRVTNLTFIKQLEKKKEGLHTVKNLSSEKSVEQFKITLSLF